MGAKLEDRMHHQDILLQINIPTEHNSKKNSLVDRVTDYIYVSMKGGEMVSFFKKTDTFLLCCSTIFKPPDRLTILMHFCSYYFLLMNISLTYNDSIRYNIGHFFISLIC